MSIGLRKTLPAVVVNHVGRRDSYQLALAFAEADLLQCLVTDFYIDLENQRNRLLASSGFWAKRFQTGLPGKKVKSLPLVAVISMINRLMKSAKWTSMEDTIVAKAAYREAKRSEANLFLYSYTAFEAFQQAIQEKSSKRRILFQLHPGVDYVKKILDPELIRYPFAAKSLGMESELQDDNIVNRLRLESQLADHVVVASSFTKESLVSSGIAEDRISVIPYGIDPEAYPYRKKSLNKSGLRVLFVGQLAQRKGVVDLLMAVKRLGSKHVTLVICTRGFYDTGILQEFSSEQVEVKRNLTHSQLVEEYHQADVFIFPSLAEGFGQVILEAMHCGTPVVTTSHTCGADVIKDQEDGYIIPVQNPDAIQERMEIALAHPEELVEVGYNGHVKAHAYSWPKFREQIIECYKTVATH